MIDISDISFGDARPGSILREIYGDGSDSAASAPNPVKPVIEIAIRPTRKAIAAICEGDPQSGADNPAPKDIEDLYIEIEESWNGKAVHSHVVMILKEEYDARSVYLSIDGQKAFLEKIGEKHDIDALLEETRKKYNLIPKGKEDPEP